MKINRRTLSMLLGAVCLGGSMSNAALGKKVVVLGTATPGGGFPAYGSAFAAAIGAADPMLQIEQRNTKGSTENVPLLEAGKLDIALVQGEVAMEALEGIGRPPAHLKVLTAMYGTAGMFAVRADSSYRAIADLKGKRVVFGARGSGLGILARYVLDGMGLDRDRDFEPVFLDKAGDGPPLVLSGDCAAIWGGGSGWPGFVAMASAPGGTRFLVPTAGEIDAILAKHAFLRRLTVPAGSFKGQAEALQSLGSWSLVLTRPDLEADVAYRLARALHQAEDDLGRRLPQASETTARNTLAAGAPERLHPGVVRYFKEMRLLPA